MRSRARLIIWIAFASATASPIACAQSGSYKWSLSPVLGLHAPSLGDLNDSAINAPMIGTGTTCPAGNPECGETEQVNQSIHLVNSPEAIGANANAGIEFQWIQSEKHVFLMGYSTWEGATSSTIMTRMPIQKQTWDVEYIRRDSVSYNEFYFGWKYSLFLQPTKYRVYSRISLNEVFDIDVSDEHVFTVQGGELDGVKRIFKGKGQTTGILMMQLGLGGEYFLKKNISVGAEAGYKYSERPFTFKDTSFDSNIAAGDNVSLVPPVRPAFQGAPLGYLPADLDPNTDWTKSDASRVPVSGMHVSFDGWALAFRVTIYY